jgi:cytochrome P450
VLSFRRTATVDIELSGQRIAQGDRVVVFHGSANFDPAVFTDPMRFGIKHLPLRFTTGGRTA